MKQPRLRDSRHLVQEVFPLGEIPNEIITKIGAGIFIQAEKTSLATIGVIFWHLL